MDKRALGKTGEKLSIIGFGGIVVREVTAHEASRFVSMAIDRGINYFDVAPEYGNAQEMLGPALRPYRDNVFLACKTHEKTAIGAEIEFMDSLKKLKTRLPGPVSVASGNNTGRGGPDHGSGWRH